MKVGVLQFFGWLDRSVPLPSIYDMALERIAIMDTGGLRRRLARRASFLRLLVCPSVHMMGVMAAARTKRLRIGTGVSLAPFYNPLRLAEEVALLDVLSGGRVNWGAGRGFERSEFKAFGIPRRGERVALPRDGRHRPQGLDERQAFLPGEIFQLRRRRGAAQAVAAAAPAGVDGGRLTAAIEWAAGKGFSILMDPHSSRTDLIPSVATTPRSSKRRPQRDRSRHSDGAPDRHRRDGREGPRGGATRGAMDGRLLHRRLRHHRQEVRTFGGKDPIDFYLDDVMLHGTADSVVDQIAALESDAGMTYLMAAPLSRRSFALLTDKVLPRVAH